MFYQRGIALAPINMLLDAGILINCCHRCLPRARWYHQMETFSVLLALCAGNSQVTGDFPSQTQRSEALILSLICAWIYAKVNSCEAGDLRRHRAHYDVIDMDLKPETGMGHFSGNQVRLDSYNASRLPCQEVAYKSNNSAGKDICGLIIQSKSKSKSKVFYFHNCINIEYTHGGLKPCLLDLF